jgi:hypothetical protein
VNKLRNFFGSLDTEKYPMHFNKTIEWKADEKKLFASISGRLLPDF